MANDTILRFFGQAWAFFADDPSKGSTMLQRIFFQDNIYQLARSIDTVTEGLTLDLARDYFFDKTVDDLLFFDASIQKLNRQIQEGKQLSNFNSLMQSLYSCQKRYLQLVDKVVDENSSMAQDFLPLHEKLKDIRRNHLALNREIGLAIQKTDKNNDSRDIVSQNELSELLNF